MTHFYILVNDGKPVKMRYKGIILQTMDSFGSITQIPFKNFTYVMRNEYQDFSVGVEIL